MAFGPLGAMVLLVGASKRTHHAYTMRRGYLPTGSDLLNATLTLAQAQTVCDAISECHGITFNLDATHGHITSKPYKVWLKSMHEWSAAHNFASYIKDRPDCDDAEYVRYQTSEKHIHEMTGPICCAGDGCPRESEYAEAESRCNMPYASPFGVPRCTNLGGTALPNLAPKALMSSSATYSGRENAGRGAATDNDIGPKLFHSQCEDGPHWFRLNWTEPIAVSQLALFNREEYLYRLVGATIALYSKSVSGADVLQASYKYERGTAEAVWTLQPKVSDVRMLEVRMPAKGVCLHFRELMVFGDYETRYDRGVVDFHRIVPTVSSKSPRMVREKTADQRFQRDGRETSLLESILGRAAEVDSVPRLPGHPEAGASTGARGAGAGTGASPANGVEEKAAGATARAHEPRAPPPRSAAASAATAADPLHVDGDAVAEESEEDVELDDEELLTRAATTGLITAAMLLTMQMAWAKVNWLDRWH